MLTSDNKNFQITASYLLDLAQRAEQLFKESDDGLRQKLLEYLLSGDYPPMTSNINNRAVVY